MSDTAIITVSVPLCNEQSMLMGAGTTRATIALVDRYTTALIAEIDSYKEDPLTQTVSSILFTGGVPLMLSGNNIARIVQQIRKRFVVASDAEITIETVPGRIDEHNFRVFNTIGLNRLSILYPSGDRSEFEALGGPGSYEQLHECNAMRCAFGFSNWDLRLPYGFPSQTKITWEKTVQKALAFEAPHITLERFSAYGHALEKDTEASFARYREGVAAIENAGYRPYAINRYAKPGFESSHVSQSFAGVALIGLGVNAVSHHGDLVYRNTDDIAEYTAHAGDPESIVCDPIIPDDKSQAKRAVCNKLLSLQAANVCDAVREAVSHDFSGTLYPVVSSPFEAYFDSLDTALKTLASQGLAKADAEGYSLTLKGCHDYVSVLSAIDEAL